MTIDPKAVEAIVKHRRSVFPADYSGERVPDEVIQAMMEGANWAPTHKFTEPWRFKIYVDEGKKAFLKDYKKAYKEADKSIDKDKLEKLGKKLEKTSHMIVIGLKRDDSLPEMEEIASVAAAVQNMHIIASAHVVGAYWSTGGPTFLKNAQKAFGWKKKDILLGFFFVGMPKKGKWPKSKRKPIDKKVEWVKDA